MSFSRSESGEVTVVPTDVPFEIMRGSFTHQRFAPHAHETYAIGTMERGTARVRFKGTEAIRRAGDVVTIAPGEVHTGEAIDPDGWAYRMLYIPTELMVRCAGGEAAPAFASSGVYDPDLAERIAAAHMVMEGGSSARTKGAALMYVMELLCERYALREGGHGVAIPRERMTDVRLHIEEHYARQVTLAELATVAQMGTFHLIREFRRAFGLPPYMYLELVRVMRAREMLQRGERVSDVAFSTGFSDQSHLTRRFKSVLGVTPGRYAKSYAPARAVGDSSAPATVPVPWHSPLRNCSAPPAHV